MAKAVVCDMDGVPVDSERRHFIVHQKALSEFDFTIDRPFYIATNPFRFYVKAFNQEELPSDFTKDIFSSFSEVEKFIKKG